MHPDNLKYSVEQIIILMEMAYIEPDTFNYRDYTIIWSSTFCEDNIGPKDKISFTYQITGGDLPFILINTFTVDFNDTKSLENESRIFYSIPASVKVDEDERYMEECVYMLKHLEVTPGEFYWYKYKISWVLSGDHEVSMDSVEIP